MPLSQIVSASIEDGAVAPVDLSSVAQYTGFKNRLINGGMQIAQRGTTTTSTGQFFVTDRWCSGPFGINTTLTQSTDVPTGFQNSLKVQRPSGATSLGAILTMQTIESKNCYDLSGQSVTVSFWAKAGANFSAAGGGLIVQVATGTVADQGAATYASWTGLLSPIAAGQGLTTTWQRFTATGTVGSGVLEMAVLFYYTPVGTAGADDSFFVTGVQIEKGVTATSFDYRPYGTELALCQRYYEVLYIDSASIGVISNYYNGTTQYTFWQYQQTKRANTTVALASGSTWVGGTPNLYGGTSRSTIGGITGFFYNTGTAGNPGLTASAEL